MSKKKKRRRPFYGSVFAPVFYNNSTTPKTTGNLPSAAPATLTATAPAESIIPPSRARSIFEMRKCLGMITEDSGWTGTSSMVAPGTLMRQGGPTIGGPGYGPYVEPGQGGVYDFANSPGLGFSSQYAWKVWQAILDIMKNNPVLPVNQLLQAGMNRSGVRYSQMDAAEVRLLEMGIEWYLSDPSKFNEKQGDGTGAVGSGPQVKVS